MEGATDGEKENEISPEIIAVTKISIASASENILLKTLAKQQRPYETISRYNFDGAVFTLVMRSCETVKL